MRKLIGQISREERVDGEDINGLIYSIVIVEDQNTFSLVGMNKDVVEIFKEEDHRVEGNQLFGLKSGVIIHREIQDPSTWSNILE